jgi:NitT/TauT family transport system substrate-binding protein
MRFNRRHVLALAVGLLSNVAAADASRAQAPVNVRFILDWVFQGQHAMFTMPVDDGTFARLGLNVTVDRGAGSGDTVTKVASGAYDIGLADLYSMVRFNAQNPGNHLIAVMLVDDKSALGVETKSSGSIKKPQDLAGKTIAAPIGDASRQLFPLFAEANKIDLSSIKWIDVSPELREPILLRNQADAITGHLTTVLPNLRVLNIPLNDIRLMPYADYGSDLYGHVLLTRPDYAERNPEVVRNFIRGAVHGFNAMITDRDGAIASLKTRSELIDREGERERITLSLEYRMITRNVLKEGASNVDMDRLERSLKAVAKALDIKDVPAAAQVYTETYLPPRAEMRIVP